MYCKYCGKQIDDDSVYCRFCGEKVLAKKQKTKDPDEDSKDLIPFENESTEQNEPASSSRRSPLKIIFAIVAAIVLLAGALVGGFAIGRGSSTNRTLHPKWSLGALDGKGEYQESEISVYTQEMFECRGLSVVLDPDEGIFYRVTFYDDQALYLSQTSYLHGRSEASFSMPVFAKYARLELRLKQNENGEDVSISGDDISKYTKKLTITVDREQSTVTERFRATGWNQMTFSRAGEGWYINDSINSFKSYNTSSYWTNRLSVYYYNILVVKIPTAALSHPITTETGQEILPFVCYSVEDGFMKYYVDSNTFFVIDEKEGYTYVSINVAKYDGVLFRASKEIYDNMQVFSWYRFV